MLDFDETKTYPEQKPVKLPPGPPDWIEGPMFPAWLLASIEDDGMERSFDPAQPRGDHGHWVDTGKTKAEATAKAKAEKTAAKEAAAKAKAEKAEAKAEKTAAATKTSTATKTAQAKAAAAKADEEAKAAQAKADEEARSAAAHQTVRAGKMTEEDINNSGAVKEAEKEPDYWQGKSSDPLLESLARQQGFNALPHVISPEEMDQYVANGEREFYRGFAAGHGYDDQFKSGAYFGGFGYSGNGTYMAYNTDESSPESAKEEASTYATGKIGGQTTSTETHDGEVMRLTLKSDAKLGHYSDLEAEARGYYMEQRHIVSDLASHMRGASASKRKALEPQLAREKAKLAIYQDVGRYATSQGYDGYDIGPKGAGVYHKGYFVLLNRSAARASSHTHHVSSNGTWTD